MNGASRHLLSGLEISPDNDAGWPKIFVFDFPQVNPLYDQLVGLEGFMLGRQWIKADNSNSLVGNKGMEIGKARSIRNSSDVSAKRQINSLNRNESVVDAFADNDFGF